MDELMKDIRPTTLVPEGRNANREDHCKASSLLVWNLQTNRKLSNSQFTLAGWTKLSSTFGVVHCLSLLRNKHLNGIKYARILLEKVPAAENQEGGWEKHQMAWAWMKNSRKEGWVEAF